MKIQLFEFHHCKNVKYKCLDVPTTNDKTKQMTLGVVQALVAILL